MHLLLVSPNKIVSTLCHNAICLSYALSPIQMLFLTLHETHSKTGQHSVPMTLPSAG